MPCPSTKRARAARSSYSLLALIAYGAALLAGNFVAPAATAVVLLAVVAAVVAAEVAYHIAIGLSLLWTRDDGEADERDRVINWRAESASGPILAVAVVVAVAGCCSAS